VDFGCLCFVFLAILAFPLSTSFVSPKIAFKKETVPQAARLA
jgi:hypothetical protein